ncbi:hypothetical protein CDEN61S_01302 [Castellaniella denitrificans]
MIFIKSLELDGARPGHTWLATEVDAAAGGNPSLKGLSVQKILNEVNRNGKAVASTLQVTGGTQDNRLGLFSADQAPSLGAGSLF